MGGEKKRNTAKERAGGHTERSESGDGGR